MCSNDSPRLNLTFLKPYIKVIYIIVTRRQAIVSGAKISWFLNRNVVINKVVGHADVINLCRFYITFSEYLF